MKRLGHTTPRDRSLKGPWRDRVYAIAAGTACFWLMYYVYVEKLRRWYYMGFQLTEVSGATLATCLAIAVAPTMVMPTQIRRFSAFITWCIYFFVYVPVIVYPVLQGLRPDVLALSLAVGLSFLLIIGIPKIAPKPTRIRLTRRTFWSIFTIAYVALNLYAVSVFGASLSLADITDVYGQRSVANDLSTGNFAGYATGWLSGCFNPLLIAIGLRHRNRLCLVIGIVGQLFVYATFAMKSTLLSVAIIMAMYYFVLRREKITFHGVALFTLFSLLVPLLMGLFATEDTSVLYDNVSAIVFMRTYGMVGALTGTYYDFFSENPQTLYSHINVVRSIVTYPYTMSVGEVIGEAMGLGMNANANFFATDGIAAAGLAGVLLIGAVIGITLRWFDGLIPRANLHLACAAAMPNVISLANASFFTALLTGGFFLLVLLCSAWRAPIENANAPLGSSGLFRRWLVGLRVRRPAPAKTPIRPSLE